ncbi:sensor histidine kinase [Microbacterium indicum]|uniref:sensor histidine kinase n=1 Tax=Microbacterium indicum TaxID=358100 RepID=UPI00040B645A|nr:sensor histidine kinase [Microbacterium indicum]
MTRSRIARWAAAHPAYAWGIPASVVAIALYSVAVPLEAQLYGVPVVGALFLTLVQYGALLIAPARPQIAGAAFALASVALRMWRPAADVAWPWSVTMIIGFALLVCAAWTTRGVRGGIVAYLAPVVALWLPISVHRDDVTPATVIVAMSIGAAAAIFGALLHERVRVRGELAAEREVSAAETERRLVVEERQRIARELHDVVAHGLSVIQVQATSARYRIPDLPGPAAAEFDDIARAARSSLAEMRRLLGALRGDDEPETAPQPTLADIARLADETRRAGVLITDELGDLSAVPDATSVAAYRIVQEAVSNAIRHAPGAQIAVSATAGGPLVVEVVNGPATRARGDSGGAGHGLVGMRERTAILGGSLIAAPTADGGFRVRAELPLDPEGSDA